MGNDAVSDDARSSIAWAIVQIIEDNPSNQELFRTKE